MILHFENGKVVNPAVWKKETDSLHGKYEVDIKKLSRRSLPQNSYLHGVLIPEFRKALNSVGYDEVRTDGQAKEIIKAMFLKRSVVNKETGEMLDYVQRTSELSKEHMSILIDEVIKYCAENMNYQIPFPNEQLEIDL